MPKKTLCEPCGESFTNIHQHRDTQKHRRNAGITREVKACGEIVTYLDGKIHSYDDLPAEKCDGCNLHDGMEYRGWYRNGKMHRDNDLPACIMGEFEKEWYQNGKMHRVGKPAYIKTDPTTGEVLCESWYQDGQLHREDGPADMEYDTGDKRWFRNGEYYREGGGPTHEYGDGKKEWRIEYGKLHRDDGPAVVWPDGALEWYQDGKLHRDDGPAQIIPGLGEIWYYNGLLDRNYGFAIDFKMLKVKFVYGKLRGHLGEGEDLIVWPDGTVENTVKDTYEFDGLTITNRGGWSLKSEYSTSSWKDWEDCRGLADDVLHGNFVAEYLRTFV